MSSPIDKFDGKYRWLSNFYPSVVQLDGVAYPSVENAYQAAKTLDPKIRGKFVGCDAKKAKSIGKRVKIREDWEDVKIEIMRSLLKQKFSFFPLAQALRDTGDSELIEGNWWGDTFWGVCKGVGKNSLGLLLMEIRGEIREESKNSKD